MLSINVDWDHAKWQEFVKKEHLEWAQAYDAGAQLQRQFNVTALPTYILIGADGTLLWRFSGWSRSSHQQIVTKINQSL